jgi:hypothetical protein
VNSTLANLLSSVATLQADMLNFTGNQAGIPGFLNQTGNLTTDIQNLMNSLLSTDFATLSNKTSDLISRIGTLATQWNEYKTATTTTSTTTSEKY